MRLEGKIMKTYKITITETMSRTVKVKAKSLKEAKLKAENNYYSEKYVLDADDFQGVTFKHENRNLTHG